MRAHFIDGVAFPTSLYGVTAAYCWLTPLRLAGADGTFIINAYPPHPFGLVSATLAVVHIVFSVRGRLPFAVAGIWAFATIATVTMFALLLLVPWATWSAFQLAQGGVVAAAAAAVCALAWRVARLPSDKHPIARGMVALGLVCSRFAI